MGSSAAEIEGEADWSGIPGTFLAALVDAGLVDERDGSYWIHDFHESQPHVGKILGMLDAKREAGRIGGLESGKARKARGKQSEAVAKQDEAERSTDQAKRTPEAEAESEAVYETGEKGIAVVPPAPTTKKPRKPRAPKPPADLTKFRDAWFETFGAENGGKLPSWGAKEAGMVKPKITAHGLADCLDRLGNFLEHYKARSFGADALALGSFVTHFDRWAKGPQEHPKVKSRWDVALEVRERVGLALGCEEQVEREKQRRIQEHRQIEEACDDGE